MLSVVATLEEFQGMLLDADIHVFADHKNLTARYHGLQKLKSVHPCCTT